MGCLQDARTVWRTLVIILAPIVLTPLILPGTSQESKCSYLLALMAVYWITESLPLPVTALLPMLALPLLGIMSAKDVCRIYFKDSIFLLLGGLIVAIAIEESNLHKRFALRLLLLLGVQPKKLMLGFMLSTGFLSMWITNTATTAMMTPIARALLARLFLAQRQHKHATRMLNQQVAEFGWPPGRQEEVDVIYMEKGDEEREILVGSNGTTTTTATNTSSTNTPDADDTTDNIRLRTARSQKKEGHDPAKLAPANTSDQEEDSDVDKSEAEDDEVGDDKEISLNLDELDSKSANLVKALCLCVCYSANIGGVGTLTGTGPNIVFKNYVETLSDGEDQVSFMSWMAFGFPVAAVILALAWLWMQLCFFGPKTTLLCRRQTRVEEDRALEEFLRREHRKLGNMSFAEKVVLLHFIVLVVLWITRSPGLFPGWSIFFRKGYVSDAVPAILVATSLFIFPREFPKMFCCRGEKDKTPYTSSPSIMQWSPLSKKFPWGVLLLLGGGFALAEATKVSGLSNLIAEQMMIVGDLPAWVACLAIVVVTSVTTEITTNTVIATLLLPILAQVAGTMGIHPVYFMLPSAVASSFAFMLPVATPPNAIVFAYGDIKVMDMVKTGVILNVISIAVVTAGINTFGHTYFNLGHVPDWAYRLAGVANQNDTAAVFNSSALSPINNVTVHLHGVIHNVTST